MITSGFGGAGAENQLAHLAEGLSRAGHDVTVVAIRRIRRDTGPLERAGVRVLDLGWLHGRTRMFALPTLMRLCRKADLVHCTGWDASLWGRIAAAAARRPVIVTEHSPGREFQTSIAGAPRAKWIARHNRLLDPFTYAMVTVGRWQVGLLEEEGVRGAIAYIPNGVPVAELRARAATGPTRSDLGIPDDAMVVSHVARFVPQKNQGVTYAAVRRLREQLGEDVHALFVGEGSERAALEQLTRDEGAPWAHFVGKTPAVPALLALSDLAVLPSSAEGLPMALLEAIALQVPIVATDVGDVGPLIESSGAGICVPPDELDAFVEACRAVLTDAELQRRFHAEAETAARHIDAAAMIESYTALFEAAVSRQPLPAALAA